MATNSENTDSLTGRLGRLWTKIEKTRKMVRQLSEVFPSAKAYLAGAPEAWNLRMQSEMQLAAVMQRRMQASKAEIGSIHRLTAAQQSLGVVGKTVQIAGAQQLASFVGRRESLETLIPAMNDLLARQHGLNATDRDAVRVADLLGKAMQGQTAGLADAGLAFSAAEQKALRYGNEAERAAALAQIVADNTGGMNQALAATPDGRLRQHANTMLDLQERIGRVAVEVQSALLPLFEAASDALGRLVGWFYRNRTAVSAFVQTVADVVGTLFSMVARIVGGVVGLFGSWFEKLSQGSVPVMILTTLVGTFAAVMAVLAAKAKLMALWSGIVAGAKHAWAMAQTFLNLAMLACPITLVTVGVIALVAAIIYVCSKINGWRSLWDGVVGFMKHSFLGYVESVKLAFATLVNGIMIGLDTIKLGWYRFKEACGLGESTENQAAIAKINADVEARQRAITDGAKKVAEHVGKARESLSTIDMSWKSDQTKKEEPDFMMPDLSGGFLAGLKERFDGKFADGLDGFPDGFPDGLADGFPGGSTGGGVVSAIAGGGSCTKSVTINLGSLVEQLTFGSYEGDRETMQHDLEGALIRVLEMANSAM